MPATTARALSGGRRTTWRTSWHWNRGRRSTGTTLLHGDLYPFNLLLTPDRVVVIDWPHAWTGATGFLLRAAATAGPGADPHIVAMMTALGMASVQWLQHRWPAAG
jgi:RIO1 family